MRNALIILGVVYFATSLRGINRRKESIKVLI